MLPGIGVGTIMCVLALCTGTPLEPLPLLFIMASARWAYGLDRYRDGKTNDSPDCIVSSLVIAELILGYSRQFMWIIPEIVCVFYYPLFKKKFPLLKPFYIGTLWANSITVIPHLIAHKEIIPNECISMALLTTGISNLADIEDIEDDKANGIHTIPATYGITPTRLLTGGLFIGSVYESGIVDRITCRAIRRVKKHKHRRLFMGSPKVKEWTRYSIK